MVQKFKSRSRDVTVDAFLTIILTNNFKHSPITDTEILVQSLPSNEMLDAPLIARERKKKNK